MHIGNAGLLMAGILAIAITFRIEALKNTYIWDYGFHMYFAREIAANYPHIPQWLDGYVGGDWVEYPLFSHFILASACKAAQGMTCFTIGKYLILAISSIAVIPVYLLTKQVIGSKDAALSAGLLYAISPDIAIADRFATPFAVLFLLTGIYVYIQGAETGSRKKIALGECSAGLWRSRTR